MLSQRLRRFDAFAGLSPGDLAVAAAHSRQLRLPAGRWLVRRGRELRGSYFLERGRVRLIGPDELVTAGSPRARLAVYPGAREVTTLSAVDLLQVDTDALAGLLGGAELPAPPLYESAWLTDGWESRFLGTHIMQRLGPGDWQRILRGMRRVRIGRGERVITEGEPGDEFYVLCVGNAEVRVAGRRLARLHPGDFFGEDALITGARRNATVVMTSDGSVMALAEDIFRAELLPLTIVSPSTDEGLVPLRAGPPGELRERLGQLERSGTYRVYGGSPGQRALTAFILTQRGFHVGAVAED